MILCDLCDDHHASRRHLKFELVEERNPKEDLAGTSYVVDLCDQCVEKIHDLCFCKDGVALHHLFRNYFRSVKYGVNISHD